MPRSPSSILFGIVLLLSFALVVWWTMFQIVASGELAAAGSRLVDGDVDGAAKALGAASPAAVIELSERRRDMFASEGAFFGLVLLSLAWIYTASVRREAKARAGQDRFLAAATHELKSPLATIALLLQSLREERLPPEKRARYLQTGLLEAERLERGLDNVLTAAGLRTARQSSRPVAGDLAADVRAAADAIRGRAFAADVTLHVDAPDQLPMVRDPGAIQLVLHNLFDNAVKYTPAGGSVHIGLAVDGGDAVVDVRDTGRGMDDNELANAFAPFWRGDDTATGGTGLGLHLVRELVTSHGGTVGATSDGRGKGSRLVVRLPLRRTP